MAAKIPSTPALRILRKSGCAFEVHPYRYVERGGTRASSEALGVDEHAVVKTLVFEADDGAPLVVLMHGDRDVSAKKLARCIGTKSVRLCEPRVAERHTGYRVGGTSPFGLRKALPVYADGGIRDLERLYINGGARGLLVSMTAETLGRLLAPSWIDVHA
jgi:Cys-tRNA(Pro) deacylase